MLIYYVSYLIPYYHLRKRLISKWSYCYLADFRFKFLTLFFLGVISITQNIEIIATRANFLNWDLNGFLRSPETEKKSDFTEGPNLNLFNGFQIILETEIVQEMEQQMLVSFKCKCSCIEVKLYVNLDSGAICDLVFEHDILYENLKN